VTLQIAALHMSAFGTKRTFGEYPSMSAFGGKADINERANSMPAFDHFQPASLTCDDALL
jgi:hypothetical protein